MSVFDHAQVIKHVHAGGGVQKMAKFCPHSCNSSNNNTIKIERETIAVTYKAPQKHSKI